MSTEWKGNFTNLKFPDHERNKNRGLKIYTIESPLSTIAWRQDEKEDGKIEPVECILVCHEAVRIFVPVDTYISAGCNKSAGRPYSISLSPRKAQPRTRRYRFLRGCAV